MELYLLGNGFDLYHRLPTKYNNFLHTVEFLLKYYDESMDTIGKVFGDSRLQEQDGWIKLCYETHKSYFDAIWLDSQIILGLVEKAKDNLWFSYLLKSYNRDLGWIDFEKEVSKVIDAFRSFFNQYEYAKGIDAKYTLDKIHVSHQYIIKQFPFFIRWKEATNSFSFSGHHVVKKYIVETPLHSGYFELNTELIAKELFDALMELGSLLREYLKYFIEQTASILFCAGFIDYSPFSSNADSSVITFNYTNVYEKLCKPQCDTCHIHGSLDSRIVLGINPTVEDDVNSIDTTFLRFKKYYQRIVDRLDDDYLETITHVNGLYENGFYIHLTVFGHSLDKTDEDIIKECFNASTEITVYYYEPDFHATIRNLIAIFGKDEFDQLRRKKSLTFKPQPTVDWEEYKSVQLQIPTL